MTPLLPGTERYDLIRHRASGFSCGNELLDRWLIRYAGQNERGDAALTFVATTDDKAVFGYCTLLAGQLAHDQATAPTQRGQSRHFPIPAARCRLCLDLEPATALLVSPSATLGD